MSATNASEPALAWNKDTILKSVADNKIDTIWHWFVDLHGILKGFAITPQELQRSLDDGMHFDGSSISGFNAIEESDLVAHPDLSTFAILPDHGTATHAARFFCDIRTPEGAAYERDPRSVLKAVIKEAQKMGFDSFMGPEIEFFIFKDSVTPVPLDRGGYFTGPPVDRGNTIRSEAITALQALGIQVEYHHHEVAESQHEIDLRYDETLRIADAAVTYKYIVKQVAHEHDAYATFMPKPIYGVNGSGMHVHQSLFKNGHNVFADTNDPQGLSAIARHYIAGLLKYAQECSCFWAPTVNSYKRLVPGYEAPVYIAWSLRNRSALIRVPAFSPGREKSVRCELRCADPSANPYLAFATMLGAGLRGIKDKLPLEPAQVDNLYHISELERERRGIKSLPSNLHEALHHTKRGEFCRSVLGDSMVENYLELKYQEFAEYRLRVSQWEIDKYLPVL